MILYKYFPPQRIDVLRDGFIRFTQLGALNDPFDCRPRLLTPDEITVKPAGENCCLKVYLAAIQMNWISTDRATMGIMCLSEKPDDLLMWAHYAQDHKGFVVGFDTKNAFFNKSPDGTGLWKVKYSEARPNWPSSLLDKEIASQPKFTPTVTAFEVKRHECFNPDTESQDYRFIKSPAWEYEQEWRLIRTIKPPYYVAGIDELFPIYLFPFPRSIVHSVFIGCRGHNLYPELRQIIEKEPAYANIELFRMRTNGTHFKLECDQIAQVARLSEANSFDDSIPRNEEPLIRNWIENEAKNRGRPGELENRDKPPSISTTPGEDAFGTSSLSPAYQTMVDSLIEWLEQNGMRANRTNAGINEKPPPIKTPDEGFDLSLKLFLLGKLDEATKAMNFAIDLCSTRAEGFDKAGMLMRLIGFEEGAQLFFCESLQVNPTQLDVIYSLGCSYLASSEYWSAECAFRSALRFDQGHNQARTNLGTIYLNQGRLPEAEACFKTVIQNAPNVWEAQWDLFQLLVVGERYQEASTQAAIAVNLMPKASIIELLPTLSAALANMISNLVSDKQLKNDVLSSLLSAIKDAETHRRFALLLRIVGLHAEALPFLRAALQQEPKRVSDILTIASAYKEIGESHESVRLRDMARQMIRKDDFTNLAILAALDGNFVQSLRCLRKAKASGQLDTYFLMDPIFAQVKETPGYRSLVADEKC
jgi:tetratricopeptide (TPR) repeat protein